MAKVSLGLITHGTGEKQWIMSFLDNEAVIHYDHRLKQKILKMCTKLDSLLSDILREGAPIANESYKVRHEFEKILAAYVKFDEFMRNKYDR